jgi:hypothetical protein
VVGLVEEKSEPLVKIYKRLSLFRVNPPKFLFSKLERSLSFLEWGITPVDVFSASLIFSLLIFLFFIVLYSIFEDWILFFVGLYALIFSFAFLIAYSFLAHKKMVRDGTSEMLLATIFLSLSYRIEGNVENAMLFAAENLRGVLGKEFSRLIAWLRSRKLISYKDAIEYLKKRWGEENPRFIDAINCLFSPVYGQEERERNADEAVRIMLDGERERMRNLVLQMKNPVRVINIFGILLPMMIVILIPIFVFFVPEFFDERALFFGYTFILPSILFLLLQFQLVLKAPNIHALELEYVSGLKEIRKYVFLISLVIFLPSFIFLSFQLNLSTSVFSITLYSFLLLLLVFSVVILNTFVVFKLFSKRLDKLISLETQLLPFLSSLSISLEKNIPFEYSLQETIDKVRDPETKSMLTLIVKKIMSGRGGFEEIVFDPKSGIMREYPSQLLKLTFRVISGLLNKGSYFLKVGIKSLQKFFIDLSDVQLLTKEVLEEAISDMKLQVKIFAPLAGGITIGMSLIVFHVMSQIRFGEEAYIQNVGMGGLSFVENLEKLRLPKLLIFSIGVYIIEMTIILSSFVSEIEFGEDYIKKMGEIGKTMLISFAIFSVLLWGLLFFAVSVLQFSSEGI